jgi:hypothetical protein
LRSSRTTRTTARIGLLTFGVAAATFAGPAISGDASSLNHDLYKLRNCESGNHWHLNTGNGYYGAYQFSPSTWRGLGFHGRPDKAQPGTQSKAALKLHSRSGWRAWPTCARKEHLH